MKKIIFSAALALALVVAPVAQAATVDMAAVMLRMQAIIAQMQELQREFAGLQSQVVTAPAPVSTPGVGAVLGAASENLQALVVLDATNETIAKVQKLLATDVTIYPYGAATGYFGPKTEEALRNLQGGYGMKQVGVVGPETAALLMSYFTAYPTGNYPVDVLKTRPSTITPAVLGASTTAVTTPAVSTPVTNPLESIFIKKDDGEIVIRVVYKNGNAVGVVSQSSSESDIVKAITKKTGLSADVVRAVLDMSQLKPSSDSGDYSKSDAEDMLDSAEEAIDDAADAIEEADDDGDDVDDAEDLLDDAEDMLDDAWDAFDDKDYDEAYSLAKKAKNLANDAEDEL